MTSPDQPFGGGFGYEAGSMAGSGPGRGGSMEDLFSGGEKNMGYNKVYCLFSGGEKNTGYNNKV